MKMRKILLAVLAADRGHQVIVSDLSGIERGFRTKFLSPGIFHTKSLTPGKRKLEYHQKIIDKGSLITSIDEEGGLVNYGYEGFAKRRYSNHSIGMSSAIFGWGEEDVETLKKIYPKHCVRFWMFSNPMHFHFHYYFLTTIHCVLKISCIESFITS